MNFKKIGWLLILSLALTSCLKEDIMTYDCYKQSDTYNKDNQIIESSKTSYKDGHFISNEVYLLDSKTNKLKLHSLSYCKRNSQGNPIENYYKCGNLEHRDISEYNADGKLIKSSLYENDKLIYSQRAFYKNNEKIKEIKYDYISSKTDTIIYTYKNGVIIEKIYLPSNQTEHFYYTNNILDSIIKIGPEFRGCTIFTNKGKNILLDEYTVNNNVSSQVLTYNNENQILSSIMFKNGEIAFGNKYYYTDGLLTKEEEFGNFYHITFSRVYEYNEFRLIIKKTTVATWGNTIEDIVYNDLNEIESSTISDANGNIIKTIKYSNFCK